MSDVWVIYIGLTLVCLFVFLFGLQVHRLVIVDSQQHVVGVVSLSDILKFLVLNDHEQ